MKARVVILLGVLGACLRGADEPRDITSLAAYNVKADRVEDFGLRVTWHLGDVTRSTLGFVVSVLPNTAADKAGLRPGDIILKSDGKSAAVTLFSMGKWEKLERQKWVEVAAGKTNVTWELEVRRPGETETRIVKMSVPTPAPHWGASKWQRPARRAEIGSLESGPLAERSRTVLENGVATMLVWDRATFLGTTAWWAPPDREAAKALLFGFEWSVREAGEGHKIFVSQQRGRTEVLLEVSAKDSGLSLYLTSPSGALEKAWRRPLKGKAGEMPLEEARAGFQAELDFWLERVGRGSGRWPLEIVATGAPDALGAVQAGSDERAKAFLQLKPADEAQRALFVDALAKLGADDDRWAYTETRHALADQPATVVRVDPAKPEGERCTLLKVDGKPPSAAALKRWREEGGDVPAALGELPPLATLVDTTDVRVWSEERAALVFELPVRGGGEFPAEKMQALFRVNKTRRTFEDITIRLREPTRAAGAARIVEAEIVVRFQTLDPVLAPQPVWLKAGGAARVLLFKITRGYEATRSDFQRVEPESSTGSPRNSP